MSPGAGYRLDFRACRTRGAARSLHWDDRRQGGAMSDLDPIAFPGGRGHGGRPQPPQRVTFERRELDRILSLYGRKVAAGEWRDYAIQFLKDRAVFRRISPRRRNAALSHRERPGPCAAPGRLCRGCRIRQGIEARTRSRARSARDRPVAACRELTSAFAKAKGPGFRRGLADSVWSACYSRLPNRCSSIMNIFTKSR
jgi:hypothetical protein